MGWLINTQDPAQSTDCCATRPSLSAWNQGELERVQALAGSVWLCDGCRRAWLVQLTGEHTAPRWVRVRWWHRNAHRAVQHRTPPQYPSTGIVITGPRKVGPPK